MTDKQREAFEAWDQQQYEIDPETYRRLFQGRYWDRPIQCRWECWTASRKLALEEAAQIALRLCDHRPPEAVAAAIRQEQEEGK